VARLGSARIRDSGVIKELIDVRRNRLLQIPTDLIAEPGERNGMREEIRTEQKHLAPSPPQDEDKAWLTLTR
jgi:hypothetical protein